jgi:hypothetical protein
MATDTGRFKAMPASKHEAFVEKELRRVRRRIRLLDSAMVLLGLVVVTLAWTLVVTLCERLLGLSSTARMAAWIVYGIAAALYLGRALVGPLCRRVNPYFAARRIEQTLPDAKNSIINWLDLRRQKLPPAIQSSLGYRAAKDVSRLDLDRALSPSRPLWLFGLAIVLGAALAAVIFVFRPTTIEIREPKDATSSHNVTVPIHQPVLFRVEVGGKIPSPDKPDRALKLLFRYGPQDPYQERLLERGDHDRDWRTTLPASQVHSDFSYKFTGGNAETEEYQVKVSPPPLLTGKFDVNYHFPYLGSKDEAVLGANHANLKALQGTDVTLVAHANGPVQKAFLECAGQKELAGKAAEDDLLAMVFHFKLDRDGTTGTPFLVADNKERFALESDGPLARYRIRFESADRQRNLDPIPYTVQVDLDQPPVVKLDKPEQETIKANGVLRLHGSASDDYGLTRLTLRQEVIHGMTRRALEPRHFRAGKFRLDDGSYLKNMEYKDFVELDKASSDGKTPLEIRPGMELEYWLEAEDNCGYPTPPGAHIAQSEHHKIKIEAPDPDHNRSDKERQDALEEQRKHETALEKEREKENKARQEENATPKPSPAELEKRQEQEREKDHQLKKELDKIKEAKNGQQKEQPKEEKNNDKGQGKGDQKSEPPGNGKGPGKPDPKAPQDPKGEGKPEAKPEDGQKKGEAKPEPKPGPEGADKKEAKAEGKGAGKQNPDPGEGKPDKGAADKKDAKGEGKDAGKPDPKAPQAPKGEGKPEAKPDNGEKKGEGKPDPKAGQDGRDKEAKGEGKGAGKQNPDQGKGDGKPDEGAAGQKDGKGEGKGAGKPDPKAPQDPKGEGKPDAKPDDGQKKGEGKPDAKASQDGGDKKDAKGEGKGAGKQNPEQGQGEAKPDKGAAGQKDGKGEGKGEGKQDPKAGQDGKGEKKGEGKGENPGQGKGKGKGEPDKGDAKGAGQGEGKGGGDPKGEGKGNPPPMDKGEGKGAGKDGAAGGQPKGAPKEGGNPGQGGGAAKGEQKPTNEPPTGKDVVQGKGPGGQPDKGPVRPDEDLKPELADLAKALDDKDAQKRQAAAKKLTDIAEHAKDAEERRQAEEVLKRAGMEPDIAKGEPRGPGEKNMGERVAPEGAPKPNPAGAAAGEPGEAKGPPKEDGGQKPDGGGKGKGAPSDQGETAGKGKGEGQQGRPDPGAQGGSPGIGQRESPATGDGADAETAAAEAEKRFQRIAGDMQLEDVKKLLKDKDLLKRAGIPPEKAEQLLKDLTDVKQPKKLQGGAEDPLANPQLGGAKLPNQRVRPVEPGVKGKEGNQHLGGPAQPPPDLRDAKNYFTQKLSEQKTKP